MRTMLATGRVRYFPLCHMEREGSSDPMICNRLSGQTWTVRYRKRLVDATFSKVEIPVSHELPYALELGCFCIPPHSLNQVTANGLQPSGFVVVGAGRTGLDTCCWLMQRAASLRWWQWRLMASSQNWPTSTP